MTLKFFGIGALDRPMAWESWKQKAGDHCVSLAESTVGGRSRRLEAFLWLWAAARCFCWRVADSVSCGEAAKRPVEFPEPSSSLGRPPIPFCSCASASSRPSLITKFQRNFFKSGLEWGRFQAVLARTADRRECSRQKSFCSVTNGRDEC